MERIRLPWQQKHFIGMSLPFELFKDVDIYIWNKIKILLFHFSLAYNCLLSFLKELGIFPKDDTVYLYLPMSEEYESIILKWGN